MDRSPVIWRIVSGSGNRERPGRLCCSPGFLPIPMPCLNRSITSIAWFHAAMESVFVLPKYASDESVVHSRGRTDASSPGGKGGPSSLQPSGSRLLMAGDCSCFQHAWAVETALMMAALIWAEASSDIRDAPELQDRLVRCGDATLREIRIGITFHVSRFTFHATHRP